MESIAVEAMGLHDIDLMYGRLWEAIKVLKASNATFFAECSSKSEDSHLLQCYVAWATQTGVVSLSKSPQTLV